MKKFLCILLFVMSKTWVTAQQLPVTVFAPHNGTLFSGANSIFQDSQGWMWFTSTYDVIRYDGHRFKTYMPSADTKKNFCYRILEVGTETWVLADPYPLKVVGDSLQQLQVKNLPGIRYNLFWKGKHIFLAADGLYEFDKDEFRPFIRDGSLAFNTDENLHGLNDSLLVSYSWSKKLVIFNIKTKTARSFDLPVYDIKQDRVGKLFMLVKGKGIFEIRADLFNGNSRIDEATPYIDIRDTKADQFIIDAENNFWIAVQDNYLLKVSAGNTNNLYKESDGLPSLWFHDMYRDREGNIWIGFNSGLCKIKNTHWKRYTISEGLYSNHIYYFSAANGNNQGYIITRSGVNVISGNKINAVKNTDGTAFTCNHLLGEAQQLFYLRDSAIYTAHIDTTNFKVSNEKRLSNLPAKALYLSKDKNGTLFIATDKGLFAWFNNKLQNLLGDTEHYHTVLADSKGRLWAARFWGELLSFSINYIKGNNILLIELHPVSSSVSSMQLLQKPRALAEDKNGNIYAGTRYDGLFYLGITGDSLSIIRRWTEDDKLKSNSIWGLATGTAGDCWVATARGINRVSNQVIKTVITDEGAAAQLYQGSSVFISGEGQVWIASHPGVVSLEKQKSDAGPFSTFITGFYMNGKPMQVNNMSASQRFGYRQNNISLDFSANTFLDEEEVRYSYRLRRNGKGEWSTASVLHSVNYPALLPGNYQFEVRSDNSSGIKSDNIAALSFKILPPFWQRAWFIGLLVLTALGIMYLLYKYRIRHLMKLQEMRNSISRNLHDDIGASLSNINILNTLAMRNLHDKQKAESWLQQSAEDIQRISESLSDIVWSINPLNDDLDNLLSYMKRYAADMLEGKNIAAELEFPVPGIKMSLAMDKRNDFFLIYKEAVNNMVKYSNATAAKIIVKQERNMIMLQVEDNGVGFASEKISKGNGLKNMQHRADNLHAELTIRSEQGKGTCIELKMKIQS